MSQRQVSGDAGNQYIKVAVRPLGQRQEARQLQLTDRDPDPHDPELCLDHLFERIVGTPHRQQRERQAAAVAHSNSVALTNPTYLVQKTSGLLEIIVHPARLLKPRMIRRNGTVRLRAKAVEIGLDQQFSIQRQCEGASHRIVVERFAPEIPHQGVAQLDRVV